MYCKIFLIIFSLISLLINNKSVFAGEKNLRKLYINSDNLVIDQVKQQAHFTGEVVLWFEDMMIKTTNLKIFYKKVNNQTKIDHIIMPSKLTATRNNTQELLIADSAKYFIEKKELILLGNIIIQSEDSIIKTDKLIYYMELNNIDF